MLRILALYSINEIIFNNKYYKQIKMNKLFSMSFFIHYIMYIAYQIYMDK